MIIGLGLAPVAVNMALGKSGDGSLIIVEQNVALMISLSALTTTIIVAIFAKGLVRLMPILAGILVGYGVSLAFGVVDFTPCYPSRLVKLCQTLLPLNLTGMQSYL